MRSFVMRSDKTWLPSREALRAEIKTKGPRLVRRDETGELLQKQKKGA